MFAGNLKQYRIIRKGFTLVELLVSMAIIIFMLSIMSQAFVIATTCMSGLKGVGELLDKGRPVLAVLQKDLSAYHFEGYKRLSDADFWDYGPPTQGYFQIYEGGNTVVEGTTADGVTYQRSGSNTDHRLAFTSRLSGKTPDDFYVTAFERYFDSVGLHPDCSNLVKIFNSNMALKSSKNSERFDFNPGILHSQWAEIAYFTKANNRTANGTPLMDLYRQQRAILPSNFEANALSINDKMPNPPYPLNMSKMPFYENFSCKSIGGKIYFNSPSDLTMPGYRMTSGVANVLYPYSDLLVTDVISFDVRILPDSSLLDFSLISSLIGLKPPALASSSWLDKTTSYWQNNNLSIPPISKIPAVFDTWTTGNDGTNQYDIGDVSTGVWQPNASGQTGLAIPIWNYFKDVTNYYPVKGLRINAIQVSIRLWDEKSQKAREFKIIQRI